ncbi:hypothetical protein Rhopal_000161-T1 [Rhodotorula paludigena]|uniref:F-box domain-containing protein n=1 Tax=Rhodotorula paludigena TaxID=86838 RepID=A0AAV5G4B5_9BASI|nr:hypothetical protein Rhopal_000161-T1 [Rhodotorula paludigena]
MPCFQALPPELVARIVRLVFADIDPDSELAIDQFAPLLALSRLVGEIVRAELLHDVALRRVEQARAFLASIASRGDAASVHVLRLVEADAAYGWQEVLDDAAAQCRNVQAIHLVDCNLDISSLTGLPVLQLLSLRRTFVQFERAGAFPRLAILNADFSTALPAHQNRLFSPTTLPALRHLALHYAPFFVQMPEPEDEYNYLLPPPDLVNQIDSVTLEVNEQYDRLVGTRTGGRHNLVFVVAQEAPGQLVEWCRRRLPIHHLRIAASPSEHLMASLELPSAPATARAAAEKALCALVSSVNGDISGFCLPLRTLVVPNWVQRIARWTDLVKRMGPGVRVIFHEQHPDDWPLPAAFVRLVEEELRAFA